MNRFSGKWPLSHWLMLGIMGLGLNGCTKTLSSVPDTPEAYSQAEMAPLESRASVTRQVPPAPAKPATTAQTPQMEVRAVLNAWRDAWANRDVPRYLSFYLPSFKGSESTPENWRTNRQHTISRANQIDLSIGEPEIKIYGPDHASASFSQNYRANNKRDAGEKKLQLRLVESRWLIERETFSASSK